MSEIEKFLAQATVKRDLDQPMRCSHTSIMDPKRSYLVDREMSVPFMEKYAHAIFYDKVKLGITEMPFEDIPVVVDVDLHVPTTVQSTGKLYDDAMIADLIEIYQNAIRTVHVNGQESSELMCVVLEKEGYVKGGNYKNGFHLHFPNAITTRESIEKYMYPKIIADVKAKHIFQRFVDMGQKIEQIIDRACFKNPWLMYGSRKSTDSGVYRLTKIYDDALQIIGGEESNIDVMRQVNVIDAVGDRVRFDPKKPTEYYLPWILSIHVFNRNEKLVVKDVIEYGHIHESKPAGLGPLGGIYATPKRRGQKKAKSNIQRKPDEIENNLKMARELVPLLNPRRAEVYDEWKQIGWILYNISGGNREGLELWKQFSMQSDKYDESVCERDWDATQDMGISIGSLCYYVHADDSEVYFKWRMSQSTMTQLIKDITKYNSHNDIAKCLFLLWNHRFKCTSMSKKVWYEFDGLLWKRSDNGVAIRSLVTENVQQVLSTFERRVMEYEIQSRRGGKPKTDYEPVDLSYIDDDDGEGSTQQTYEMWEEDDENDERRKRDEIVQKMRKSIRKIVQNVKNASYKDNVMKELAEVFYDGKFEATLDTNPHLIGVKNGVIDLETNQLRTAHPDDRVMMCMGVEYNERFSKKDPDVIAVIKFIEEIFPDAEVREYFLDVMCDVFVGGNPQKLVMVWTGDGDNGKSMTQLLVEKMMGEYAIKLPTSLITGKRTQSSSACPELARAGNGVRWVVLQEPDQRDVLNVGLLKELSGNDSFFARKLFQDGGEIKPMFKIAIICNDPPKIPYSDKATWNRIRVIPFESTFCDDPPTDVNEQKLQKRFAKDPSFIHRLDKMAAPFFWYLINHRRERKERSLLLGTDKIAEPMKVKLATSMYRERNDSYRQFIAEYVVESPEGKLRLAEFYGMFKDWYRESMAMPPPSKNEVKDALTKLWGESQRGSVWKGYKIQPPVEELDDDIVEDEVV